MFWFWLYSVFVVVDVVLARKLFSALFRHSDCCAQHTAHHHQKTVVVVFVKAPKIHFKIEKQCKSKQKCVYIHAMQDYRCVCSQQMWVLHARSLARCLFATNSAATHTHTHVFLWKIAIVSINGFESWCECARDIYMQTHTLARTHSFTHTKIAKTEPQNQARYERNGRKISAKWERMEKNWKKIGKKENEKRVANEGRRNATPTTTTTATATTIRAMNSPRPLAICKLRILI